MTRPSSSAQASNLPVGRHELDRTFRNLNTSEREPPNPEVGLLESIAYIIDAIKFTEEEQTELCNSDFRPSRRDGRTRERFLLVLKTQDLDNIETDIKKLNV
jgi:hypothetical protein